MRPALLNTFFSPASVLPGVGPKVAALFDRLVGRQARVLDVLFHLPVGVVDRRARPKVRDAVWDSVVTLEVVVAERFAPLNPRSKAPYKVRVEDETGDVTLIFFHNNHAWVEKALPIGARRIVSGKLELYDGRLQMTHPHHVLALDEIGKLPLVEPVYAMTEGLFPRVLAKAIDGALARMPVLPEWATRPAVSFGAALAAVHHPATPEAIAPNAPARMRLAYDELLANQLALLIVRARMRQANGRASLPDGRLTQPVLATLPFTLTAAQTAALADITADIAAERRMLRLLQGDVGSGKTIVALIAMLCVVEAGRQAALMAPTEILARQHFERLAPLAAAVGVRTALLTGRDTAAERARTLAGLASGEIALVMGTHALFQESVGFRDLALAIIDEQHRFGVRQRLALGAKGEAVDILVMTATPIPRTLVLTYFGDMEVSTLREKPPGRQPIETRAIPLDRLDEVATGLARAFAAGARVYWICPLVEDNEDLDLAAAQDRYETLSALYGARVGLVHGRMKGRDKDAAMEAFARGETQVLVATTVVEVGVDVPEATVMVIEHAERFGLAQLHQLRGRVGRGAGKSSCLLLYKAPLGEVSKARIEILRESEDGFAIAEEDLRLRGEGEVLGARQSGLPGFRLADLAVHGELLKLARNHAQRVFSADPQLRSDEGRALRVLLQLFERDEAMRLLEAG